MMHGDRGTTVRQIVVLAFVAITAFAISACGDNRSQNPTTPTPAGSVSAVVVTSASTSPSSFQLTATAQMTDGSSRDVTSNSQWQSSNPLLATVSAGGMVTVVASGELDVRATYQNITGALHLLVTKLPVASVPLSGAPSSSSMTFQLTATAKLSDGSTQDVTRSATWESSNTQLATVSATGVVTMLGNGEVDIRATYQGVVGTTHVTTSVMKAFTVGGIVTEAAPNAQRVVGARVQIVVGDHAISDAQGAFSIANVPSGRTILEVTKDGYQTFSNEFTVDHDLQLAITLYPTPPANSSGALATARCNDKSWSWAQTRAEACALNGGIAYPVCPGPLCGS